MNSTYSPYSCVVLTTPERLNLFSSVLGEGADVRLDPDETAPLDRFLEVVALSGGKTVVLDEAHFYRVEDLLGGLTRYLDGGMPKEHPMRFIVVSSRRAPGDGVLAYLAMYCGIYDLIYGAQRAEVTVALGRMLERENTRSDILEVFTAKIKHKERKQTL